MAGRKIRTPGRAMVLTVALALILALIAGSGALAETAKDSSTRPVSGETLSNEEAVAGYIRQEMDFRDGTDNNPAQNNNARKNLNKWELEILRQMKEFAREAAAGQLDYTVMELDNEAFNKVGGFSAEDLGLATLTTLRGEVTRAAKEACLDKIYQAGSKARDALLADCPYEMYWHDKTEDNKTERYGDGFRVENGRLLLTDDLEMDFFFTVAQEYSLPAQAGNRYTYRMNSLPAKIQTAKQNAKAIVEKYQNLSDTARMRAYKDEICRLTEYNYNAVNARTVVYGDPWQLIWIFDGDPATKVVCEGYAKGFKYLCDMSRFREKVTVTLVTGQYLLDSNVAAGRQNPQIGGHMWNLVRMNNGFNYLVDVTNCDRGETGDDSMFMVGYTKAIRPGKEYLFKDRNGGNQYYIYDQDTLDLFPFGVLEVTAFDRDESRDSQAERMPGDVNADGIVDGRDVIELMKFIAGDEVEIDEAWGDVNADGVTDAKDLLLLVRYLGGEKVTLK